MLSNKEDLQVFLTARRYLYVLFQSLLGNEPTSEQIAAIDIDLTREALAEMKLSDVDANDRFLTLLHEIPISDLRSEYTKLFLGPEELKAPPWGTVYILSEKTLFTAHTLEVRKFYRAQGFIPAEYPHVADDHLAIELDFLAQLAARLLDDYDSELGKSALAASKEFLPTYLLKWLPEYLTLLQQTKAQFYPLVASAMLSFLERDYELLSSL